MTRKPGEGDDSKADRLSESYGADVKISDVAEMFGVHVKTIRRWIDRGRFPVPDIRINQRVMRWRRTTIAAFMDGGTDR